MNILWLRFRIGFKIALGVILAAYMLLFVLMNKGKPVELWLWFGTEKPVSLLTSLVLGMIFGILLAGAGIIAWGTIGQIRMLRKLEKAKVAAAVEAALSEKQQSAAVPPPAAAACEPPPAAPDKPESDSGDESVYKLK